uniref:ATP synthase complex subunit 8 n=1 Tax=Cryptocephalus schaefferi TaxID=1425561 RepID=A0A3G1GRF5_9CUCU|nr:ATP synthase F0 subunit 8 [Cryptocephalus schaefferi]
MPQMAPLNWLTLFFLFSIYIMVFSSMNYFFFVKTPIMKLFKNINFKQNWLW